MLKDSASSEAAKLLPCGLNTSLTLPSKQKATSCSFVSRLWKLWQCMVSATCFSNFAVHHPDSPAHVRKWTTWLDLCGHCSPVIVASRDCSHLGEAKVWALQTPSVRLPEIYPFILWMKGAQAKLLVRYLPIHSAQLLLKDRVLSLKPWAPRLLTLSQGGHEDTVRGDIAEFIVLESRGPNSTKWILQASKSTSRDILKAWLKPLPVRIVQGPLSTAGLSKTAISHILHHVPGTPPHYQICSDGEQTPATCTKHTAASIPPLNNHQHKQLPLSRAVVDLVWSPQVLLPYLRVYALKSPGM